MKKLASQKLTKDRVILLSVVAMVVLVGVAVLAISKAATATSSIESESGTVNGVSVVTDNGASGGKAVKFGSVASTCTGVKVSPGPNTIQTAIAANGTNTTFCLAAGIYRITSVIAPKAGQSLIGAKGAVINGSLLLSSGWTANGTNWYISGQLPAAYSDSPPMGCEDNVNNPCLTAEWVYSNDIHLTKVANVASVGPGKFYLDYAANRVYIGDDPATHTIELSRTNTAINSTGSGVTLQNLVIEKFASHAQAAAVVANAAGWILKNNEIRYNHGAAVDIIGSNGQVRNNFIHDNGETGVVVYNNTGTVVDSNELSHNNIDGFLYNDGENGGLKSTKSAFTVSNNYVHDNLGLGIWSDVDEKDVTINGNYIANNYSDGIRFEISYNGYIFNNTLVNNGVNRGRVGCTTLGCGASIAVSTSNTVQVHDNVIYKGDSGIGLIAQNRGSGLYGLRDLTNVKVYNNTITLSSGYNGLILSGISDTSYFTTKGNSFTGNHYHLSNLTNSWFKWNGSAMTNTAWQTAGNDKTGSFDTTIPAAPTPPKLTVGPQ